MSLEALVLGLLSGLRPGTSLAAALALVKTPAPKRLLLFFTVAGLAWSWTIGLVVVGVFHGADVGVRGSTFTAALNIALGGAALVLAAGLHRGWISPTRRRISSPSTSAAPSRLARRLRSPSVAAAAGVGTHLPGLIYLLALTAIASTQPALVDTGVQVAIYDALWFVVPIASLVLVILRPGTALAYLDSGTAWVRSHEHAILVSGSLVLGGYLVAKGMASLLT
jgi:Sap, sulfolipid-1-addressing protein